MALKWLYKYPVHITLQQETKIHREKTTRDGKIERNTGVHSLGTIG